MVKGLGQATPMKSPKDSSASSQCGQGQPPTNTGSKIIFSSKGKVSISSMKSSRRVAEETLDTITADALNEVVEKLREGAVQSLDSGEDRGQRALLHEEDHDQQGLVAKDHSQCFDSAEFGAHSSFVGVQQAVVARALGGEGLALGQQESLLGEGRRW